MRTILRTALVLFLSIAFSQNSHSQYGPFQATTVNVSVAGNYPLGALLYTPSDYATAPSNKRWPLIVFLHGTGEAGTNLSLLLNTGLPKKIYQGQKPVLTYLNYGGYTTEAFVICPQNGSFSLDPNRIPAVLRDMTSRFRIDSSRIYLTGLSAGGNILGMIGGYSTAATDTGFNRFISAQFARSPHNGSMVLDSAYRVGKTWKTPTALIVGAVNDGGTENAFRQFCIDLQARLVTFYSNSFYEAIPGWAHNNFDVTYDTARRYASLGNRNFYEWLAQYTNSYATPYNGALGNVPPTANAGPDQTISLQKGTVSLSGTGIDTDGSITGYSWTKIYGGNATIQSPGSASTNVSGLVEGTYKFRLTVTDNNAATHSDDMLVYVVDSASAPSRNPDNYSCTNAFKIVVLGSSTAQGAGSVPYGDSAWVGKFRFYIKSRNPAMDVINLANAGYTSYDILRPTGYVAPAGRPAVDTTKNITKALSYQPDAIIINLASNDAYNGYSLAEVQANFEETMRLADSAHVPVWVTTSQPRTSMITGNIPLLTGFRDWVYTRFGNKAIDFWDIVCNLDSTTINPIYSYGDGIHLNNLGHHVLYKKVVEEHILDSLCARAQQVSGNISPVANAGTDQIITLPTNSVTLTGSGTDPDGSIAAYSWVKLSGGAAVITSSTNASTTVTGLVQGVYQFVLTVTDNNGATGKDTVQVTVNGSSNLAPVANAGTDQTITLPANSVTLTGSGTDPDGSVSAYGWVKLSGGAAVITTPSNASTTVTGLVQGVYQFVLTVTDNGGATAKDTIQVTVNAAANLAPAANAGPDQNINLPANSVTVNGSGTDPDGTISSYSWTKVSGGVCTITSPSNASTTITGIIAGTYVFRLTVIDNGGASATDDMIVTLSNSSTIAPTANAGLDQTIILPQNFTTLYGGWPSFSKKSVNGGPITQWSWTQIAGPGSAYISKYEEANVNATLSDSVVFIKNLVQGVYDFQLSITDSAGGTDKDTVRVTVQNCNYNPSPKTITLSAGVYWPKDAAVNHNILPGDTILLNASTINSNTIDITLGGINGCPGQPIVIKPINGVVTMGFLRIANPSDGNGNIKSSYIHIDGSGIANQKYGIKMKGLVMGTAHHMEANNLSITNSNEIGIATAIADNTNLDRLFPVFYQRGMYIHDNYVANHVNEGMYIGSTSYGPGGWNYGNAIQARGDSIFVYNNIIENTGWDGLQVSSNGYTEIYNNSVYNTGTANAGGQKTGISLGTGAYGKIYNNVVRKSAGQGILVSGYDSIRVYNNFLDSCSFLDTSPTNYPAIIYSFGAHHAPEAVNPQRLLVKSNYIRNPFNSVRAIQITDYNNIADPGRVDSNRICLPNLASVNLNNYIFVADNPGSTATGNVSSCGWAMPSLPLASVCGPTLADPAGTACGNVIPNMTPSANAGPDQVIVLPQNTVTLNGSGFDSDGSITSHSWTKISGPAATVTSASNYTTTVTGLTQGVYLFMLTVTDNGGLSARDTMKVTVNAAANQPPAANAGTDITITLPTNSVTLSGSGTDADGTIASYAWTKLSGGAATITSPSAASTTVTGLVQGVYLFVLTVTDNGGLTAKDTVQVTVNPGNLPPVANAGPDQTIVLPASSVSFSGSGTDADGTIAGYAWTKLSGGAASITSPTAAATTVTGLVQGVYLFVLTVTDNKGATGKDTVQVNVSVANNQAPVANAGNDKTITLPVNSVTVTGSGTDPDGNIVAYQWRKIGGPSQFSISSPTSAQTTISGLAQGVYTFELMVTDNGGLSARDTVVITVNAAPNQAPVANAGPDQSIVMPANTVLLSGSASDADGTITGFQWTMTEGPAACTISSPGTAQTTITGLLQGIYKFELTVTDNNGATATDVVVITVLGNSNTRPGFLDFSVYPNPVSENTVNLRMAFDSSGEKYTICIYSLSGVKVFQSEVLQTVQNGTIYPVNISGFAKGVYIVRLVFNDDRKMYKKFVRQ